MTDHPGHGVFWPALTLALVSAASMALEIVAGRALAPYVGMSLYTWTVIIAVVLAGLSVGHWIGGILADRSTRPARPVALSLGGAAITSYLCLAVLQWLEPHLSGRDPIARVSLLALGAFLLPSFLAGIVSPLLTVMAQEAGGEERRGRVLGLMFALGAFGAILGTLAAGLVLISWIGTAGSVALIALIYALLGLRFWSWRGRVAAAGAILILSGGGIGAPSALGLRSPCLEESAYFCIRTDDIGGFGRASRVMVLDHLVHGVNDRDDPGLLLSPYVQGVDELIAARFPGPAIAAFFVGGGAYTLPRAWQARYPEGQFSIAELDPAVTRIAEQQLWFDPGDAVIHHGDARQVLQDMPAGTRFDVIFGDAFHDISVPPHLVTDEFHATIRERLAPGGVYILNIVDALREPRFMLSLAATLKARFSHVELWLDVESLHPQEARTTWIVLASDDATVTERLQAQSGFGREWARVQLGEMIRAVGPDKLVVLTDDFAPVNRLLSTVLLSAALSDTGGGLP